MSIIEWKVYARNSRLRLPWVGCRWQSGRLESEQRLPERAAGAIGTEPLRSDSWRDAESSRRSSPTGADPRRLARPCRQTTLSHCILLTKYRWQLVLRQGSQPIKRWTPFCKQVILVILFISVGRTYQNLGTISPKTIWAINFQFITLVNYSCLNNFMHFKKKG